MAKSNKLFIMVLLIIALLFSSYVLATEITVQSGTCGTCSWEIDDTGLLRIYPTNGDSGILANSFDWSAYKTDVTKVVIEDGVIAGTSTANMFNGMSNCIEMDLSGLDTSNVTNMAGIFSGCSGLTELDVSNFDTINVTNMDSMFNSCSLISLDVSNFNTSNVTTMNSIFAYCSNLAELDLSNFDTSNVTNMRSMFSGCSGLTSLDLSGFDTSNVTNMSSMFNGCSGLTELDVSNFDTSNVTNMYGMFYGCKGLTELDISNFDTSNVTNMGNMFRECSVLTSLDLSNFNTSKVCDMNQMFRNCSSLTKLNVSNFDTSKVTKLEQMFWFCSSLTKLDLSSFNTSNVTNMFYMLSGCSNLTELDLSGFDTSNVTNMTNLFYGSSNISKITFSPNFYFLKTEHRFTGTTSEWMKIRNLDGSKTYDNTLYSKDQMLELDSTSLAGVWVKNYQGDDHTTLPDGSVEYVSNDDYWQIVSDTTWKYTFTVFNDTLNYKLFEEYMEGYQSNAMAPYYIEVHNGHAVIENKLTAKKYGQLQITKTVEGNTTIEDEFEFIIILSGINVSGTKIFNGVVFENGLGKFTLKANETKIFTLPIGTHYAISEKEYIQYTSVITNEAGVIEANETQAVDVVNTYIDIPEPDNNKVNLTLKKTVSENCDSDTEFYISGYFTNLEPNTTYQMSDGNSFTSNEKGIAYCDVVLKHQNELIFYNLPVGATYQFTEHENDYVGSVNVKDNGNIKQENANTISGVTTSIETDSIGENEDILVHFHSDTIPLQNLLLYKKVVQEITDGELIDYPSDESFEFTIYFSNIPEGTEFSSDIGKITGDEQGEATKTFYIKNGEVVQFYDIPKDVQYVIMESATEYVATYDINGLVSTKNEDKEQSLSTEKEVIEAGEDNIVTFTNIKPLKVLTTIYKVDENNNLLSGAVLKLLDSEGNVIDEWETTDEEHLIYLAPGQYTLQEMKAPNGYLLAEELNFEVVVDEENTITMVNKPIPLLTITGGNGTSVTVFIALLFSLIMVLLFRIGKLKSSKIYD